MTWTRLSDNFDGLSIELSDAAFRTHVLALLWSNRTLTDGRLPARALGLVNATPQIVSELENAGFWTATEGGYQIDWTDQETSERVKARRSANAEANRALRERKDRHASGDHSKCDPRRCEASRSASRDRSRDGSQSASVIPPRPDPSRPDPTTPSPPDGEEGRDARGALPSPFCPKHPDGTDSPCRACGTARMAHTVAVAAEKTKPTPLPRRPKTCAVHAEYPLPCDRCELDAAEAAS